MPRQPRIISEFGYYHIYTRGNGKQILYENREDYIYYLKMLKKYCVAVNVTVCAFCLMENHVHLIVYDPEPRLPELMKLLNTAYAKYFNEKYKRKGHVFESRYCRIPIESEAYLLTVFRYILNNPQKAGICTAANYPWSSYSRYGEPDSFVDTSVLVDLIGSKAEYETYIAAKYEDCPELEEMSLGDEWAKSVIRRSLNISSGTALQSFDLQSRNKALRLLKQRGLTVKQIERLTGISQSAVEQA